VTKAWHYDAIRKVVRTGDLFGTLSPGMISHGIQRVTHGDVSHVCGAVVVQGRRCVLETTLGTGVHLVPLSRWVEGRKGGPIYWWPARFTEEEQDRYASALFDRLGARYESPTAMLLRVALRRKVKPNDRWFCSEIEATARVQARPSQFMPLWPEPSQVWPCHVADAYGGVGKALQVTA